MTCSHRLWSRLISAVLIAPVAFASAAIAQDSPAEASSETGNVAEGGAPPAASFTLRSSMQSETSVERDPETGEIAMIGYTLGQLLAQGWGVHPRDILAPDTDLEARYDVRVLLRSGPKRKLNVLPMFKIGVPQALKLNAEVLTAEGPVNRLRPAKDTPQLQPSTTEKSAIQKSENSLVVTNTRIAELAAFLRWHSPRPIVDESGLEATYDFVLQWDPSGGTAALFHALNDIGLEIFPDEGSFGLLRVTPAE
ncbi:MAG: TIGR03435 family protein [Myxococcota bacterium]|nr:TIGR03435 family protein [Myxococcota bacterium]